MNDQKGNSIVEFVLILPWFLFLFLGVLSIALLIIRTHFLHWRLYQEAEKRSLYDPKSVFQRVVPVHFALEGVSIDLNRQTDSDPFDKPRMDNFIGYCGEAGRYFRCQN